MSLSRPVGLRAGFHADAQDPASGLVHAGEQWASEQFPIDPHRHPVWELYVQLHGVTRWAAGRETFTLHPGQLLAVPPGLDHHLTSRSGAHHFSFAAVDLEPVRRRQPALPLDWPPVAHHLPARDVPDAMAQVVRELTLRHEHAGTGLALAVDHLALTVVRAMAAAPATPVVVLHPAVTRVKHLLDHQVQERWTLRRLAADVGLAPTYLVELFDSQVGQTPHRYLNERRIDRARRLLASSDLTVTAMAHSLGFSSSQHFARVFRQFTGTTPTAFRGRDGATAAPPGSGRDGA